MANALYEQARITFATAKIDWMNDNIKVAMLSPAYIGGTVATDTHTTFADIRQFVLTGANSVRTLTNKVTTVITPAGVNNKGALSAASPTFVALTTGQVMGYYVFFKDKNPLNIDGLPALVDDALCPLIALNDSGYGLGSGTTGKDVVVNWDPKNGILKL